MSATMYWEPVKTNRRILGLGAAAAFMEALHSAHPAEILDEEAIPVLGGMYAATTYDDWRRAIDTLLDAIEKYGEIRIGLTY